MTTEWDEENYIISGVGSQRERRGMLCAHSARGNGRWRESITDTNKSTGVLARKKRRMTRLR